MLACSKGTFEHTTHGKSADTADMNHMMEKTRKYWTNGIQKIYIKRINVIKRMLPVGTSTGIVHWYESHESWWFHRIWNNNETKGLCDFTVHALDSTCYTCSTWKTTKVFRRWSSQNTRICILTKCFKQRKLKSWSEWKCLDNGPPAVILS